MSTPTSNLRQKKSKLIVGQRVVCVQTFGMIRAPNDIVKNLVRFDRSGPAETLNVAMKRGQFLSVIGLASLALAGCDGPRGAIVGADAMASTSLASEYRLTPGDKIKVTVFNEADLTGEFQVNESGNVAFPLTGEVAALGKSVPEFKAELVRTLRGRFVKNPKVSVEVANYRPFNVVGEVKNSGQFQYRPGLSMQDAVAMAGGYTYRANTRLLYVRRADAGGESSINPDERQVPVLPGDNIRIPERYF